MATFTAKEKANAALAEVRNRRWVYSKLVSQGRKTQAAADKAIAIMEEIEREYRTVADAEEAAGRLL